MYYIRMRERHIKRLQQPIQATLPFEGMAFKEGTKDSPIKSSQNNILSQDHPFHNWYRFVLSYPPHLVRDYIQCFGLSEGAKILDPFCGTGTTVVEAKLNGIASVGTEANPFPHFASSVKTDWSIEPDYLLSEAEKIADAAHREFAQQKIDDRVLLYDEEIALRTLPPDTMKVLIKNSISPLPLHKTLVLLDKINLQKFSAAHRYFILGLGNALVNRISNLRFGPEVGVGKLKEDVSVIAAWMQEMRQMTSDLNLLQITGTHTETDIHLADARQLMKTLQPCSIDAVITSPPYPNEKDYTRTTRLESVVLGFYQDMSNLRGYKKTLLRSNTRGVYVADEDDAWVAKYDKIQKLAATIEERRIELGKTSGFEKLYPRVTKLYFGGMVRHLETLKSALRPGAKLAYVVGDQASYLRVMIRTGELLAEIAEDIGYQVERIDLFRTRFATATQCDLREEVLVLTWPGK